METILQKIIHHRAIALEKSKSDLPLSQVESIAQSTPIPSSFLEAVSQPRKPLHIISEVKKASPSKGLICPKFDPVPIAQSYQQGGASALSVLTEERFFQGHAQYLRRVANEVNLPILRKDFIIDSYQVVEARALGASAFLLIVDCLDNSQLKDFIQLGHSLSLTALVEVHRQSELDRALACGAPIIGINNRDLRTFKTSLNTTFSLRPQIPKTIPVVSESGIHSPRHIELLYECNVQAVLIGEAFMRNPETILDKMSELLGTY